jgi:phage tail sheath protein FI
MPIQPTYPGVYIQETPSPAGGTITGVATAITAFVGRMPMGPINEPVSCTNFGDFQHQFGGLSKDCPATYAVQDFFQNGGGQALIVRVEGKAPNPTATAGAPAAATVTLPAPFAPALTASSSLVLNAVSNGSWGNALTASIDRDGITEEILAARKSTMATCFNLSLMLDRPGGAVVKERFLALTVEGGPYRSDRVLAQQSSLAVAAIPPKIAPADTPEPLRFSGGIDGPALADGDIVGDQSARTGLYALERADLFNLLCIPWDQPGSEIGAAVHAAAATYCVRRRAVYIADGPAAWADLIRNGQLGSLDPGRDLGIADQAGQRNTAVYFPRIVQADPENGGKAATFSACGAVAGQIAHTDATKGVWKAPAGIQARLAGVTGLAFPVTDSQNGVLSAAGINCLRSFPNVGPVSWGSRTLRGADALADDFMSLPVRRLTLYIEESLYRSTKFAVFEPNTPALWSKLKQSIDAFMTGLLQAGAFYQFTVTCDATTTTAADIARGVCNILVAFAPNKPGAFIILQIAQIAGAGP